MPQSRSIVARRMTRTHSASLSWNDPALNERVRTLLKTLETECGLKTGDNIGNKLANRKLSHEPIIQTADLAAGKATFPASTVHQVKGESIDAVMYIANRSQIADFLNGMTTEVGKIGYVALTRAKNLFLLGVPENCEGEFRDKLEECGLRKPGL
jgi:hypothetical protein